MRVLDPGHDYLLTSYDGGEPIRLTFMKREGAGYPGNVGTHSGTNLQEVLRMMVDRILLLDAQVPCDENRILLSHWRADLLLLEQRAARRHGRVLATLDHPIEQVPTCPTCGHIQCDPQTHHGGTSHV